MLQIASNNEILIDGQRTGLSIVQKRNGSVVYTPESHLSGEVYREHKMPHTRYSTAHDGPASGVAGYAQLEVDLRALMVRLGQE